MIEPTSTASPTERAERRVKLSRLANEIWDATRRAEQEGMIVVSDGPFLDLYDQKTGDRTPLGAAADFREAERERNGLA
jgi:hypothetical protein